ncbi:hypothetical protein [Bradyrhizobium sp. URHC0002]
MIRRLILPLTAAVVTFHTGQAFAQSAFPAPLPSQTETPASSTSPVPHMNGAPSASPGASAESLAGSRSDACMNGFAPLREEAEKRGKLIKAASERHASPVEGCELIGSFGRAEIKMIKYVEANAERCGIPPRIADQLRNGHKNTEKMQKQVCTMAQRHPSAGSDLDKVLGPGDFWPASAPFPD